MNERIVRLEQRSELKENHARRMIDEDRLLIIATRMHEMHHSSQEASCFGWRRKVMMMMFMTKQSQCWDFLGRKKCGVFW